MDLVSSLTKILEEYKDDVNESLEGAFDSIGDIGLKKIKASSEQGGYGSERFNNRKYSKGWDKTVEKHKLIGQFHATIYNKKYYRLTHLLEFGHATRDGGRTSEFPHIAPVQEMMDDISVTEIEEAINDIK